MVILGREMEAMDWQRCFVDRHHAYSPWLDFWFMNRALFYLVAALCGIAMLPGMPYGYFMLLRLCVCAVSIYGAVQMSEQKAERMAWGCVALAVLFNPVIKIHLGRDLWWFMDGVAAIFLCAVARKIRP